MCAKSQLSSRERILCTLSHKEPDHVPLWNLWRKKDLPFSFRDECKRVEAVLKLGLDDSVLIVPPGPSEDELIADTLVHPVKTAVYYQDKSSQDKYPLITREYQTPQGTLRQVIRKTQDWPFVDDIPLLSDFNISRAKEHLVKNHLDLKSLKYILKEPTGQQIKEYRECSRELKDFAHKKSVLLEGGRVFSADAAVWLFGLDSLILKAIDSPDFVVELLELIYQWQKPRIELLLEEEVDLIIHSGWYEMPHLWSPRLFRQLLKPILAKEIALTHSAGVQFCYILTAGSSLILQDLLELGVDVLRGVDPVQGYNEDLALIKNTIGDRITIWGGMNAAITLGKGKDEKIREAVNKAIRSLAPGGGFVLYPVDQIRSDTPWENVQTLIDCWKQICQYPIRT